jgi:hypothetical protein
MPICLWPVESNMPKGIYIRTKPVWNKGIKTPQFSGENHPNWKGDSVGYMALHAWMNRMYGKPSKCERCGTTEAKVYNWANVSREYKRDRSDWERLCRSCHVKDTFAHGEQVTWNKGKKTGLVPKTAFKKGDVPWWIKQGKPNPGVHS